MDPADLLQYSVKNELLGIYQCTLCSEFSHKSRANVRNHIESKHFPNSFSYPCHFCEKILPSHQSLLKHKSVYHKNEVAYWNKMWNKLSRTKLLHFLFLGSLTTYIEEVEGGFMCQLCSKIMKFKHDAKRHIKMQHAQSGNEQITCDYCNKILKHQWALGDHMRRFHGLSAKQK